MQQGKARSQGKGAREKGEDRRPILETLGITPVSYWPERNASYQCLTRGELMRIFEPIKPNIYT